MSDREVWERNLEKVGIPAVYWPRIIEAAHDLAALRDDGMHWTPETGSMIKCPECGAEMVVGTAGGCTNPFCECWRFANTFDEVTDG